MGAASQKGQSQGEGRQGLHVHPTLPGACGGSPLWEQVGMADPKPEGAKNTTFADRRVRKGRPPAIPAQDDLSEGRGGGPAHMHPRLRPSGLGSPGDQAPVRPAGSPRQVVPASGRPWAQLSSHALCPAPASSPLASPRPPLYLCLPAWRCPPGAGGWEQDRRTEICPAQAVRTLGHHGPRDLTLPLGAHSSRKAQRPPETPQSHTWEQLDEGPGGSGLSVLWDPSCHPVLPRMPQ